MVIGSFGFVFLVFSIRKEGVVFINFSYKSCIGLVWVIGFFCG